MSPETTVVEIDLGYNMRFEIHLCFFCFLSLFLIQPMTKNFWITKVAVRKKIGPWNTWKTSDLQNTHNKKFCTHETPTRKNFTPRNNHEKNFFEPTKHSSEKMLDPWSTHEKKCRTHETPTNAWWHDYTKPTMARNPHNLTHSCYTYSIKCNNGQKKLTDTTNSFISKNIF